MVRVKDILDALEAELKALFPGETVYRNPIRKDLDRPSAYVELGKMTMEDAARQMVDRTAQAKITLFVPVSEGYHDGDVDVLADRLTLALLWFSDGALSVGDRWLDLEKVTGEYFNDYAELTFTLRWMDERKSSMEEEREALRHYDLTLKANGKEIETWTH